MAVFVVSKTILLAERRDFPPLTLPHQNGGAGILGQVFYCVM